MSVKDNIKMKVFLSVSV